MNLTPQNDPQAAIRKRWLTRITILDFASCVAFGAVLALSGVGWPVYVVAILFGWAQQIVGNYKERMER